MVVFKCLCQQSKLVHSLKKKKERERNLKQFDIKLHWEHPYFWQFVSRIYFLLESCSK